jgi:hypothetical protein
LFRSVQGVGVDVLGRLMQHVFRKFSVSKPSLKMLGAGEMTGAA